MPIDTVTLNIVHNALTNIASEMALIMLKTSYSTIFNEGLDFTTVLLDKNGDLIAEKNYTPSMMGAIPHTVKWAVDEKGIDHFHPGDVLVRVVRRRPRVRRHEADAKRHGSIVGGDRPAGDRRLSSDSREPLTPQTRRRITPSGHDP